MQKLAPQGMRRPKHSIEFIRAYFAQAGCKLLTKTYLGSKQELEYLCRCGKKGVCCYNNFTRSRRECQSCLMKKCEVNAKSALKPLVLREKLYNISEAAMWLGVPHDDFYQTVRYKKLLPAPTRVIPGKLRPYYHLDDLKKIKKMIR
jgi:hypothetical protein